MFADSVEYDMFSLDPADVGNVDVDISYDLGATWLPAERIGESAQFRVIPPTLSPGLVPVRARVTSSPTATLLDAGWRYVWPH